MLLSLPSVFTYKASVVDETECHGSRRRDVSIRERDALLVHRFDRGVELCLQIYGPQRGQPMAAIPQGCLLLRKGDRACLRKLRIINFKRQPCLLSP